MRKNIIFLSIIVISTTFSCKKEILKSLGNGDVIGYVNTREDIYYHPYEIEASGVYVTLLAGSNTYNTTTDSNGKFIFTDIAYGDYNLKFEKTGYNSIYVSMTHIGEAPTYISSPEYPVNVFEQPYYKILSCQQLTFNYYSESGYNSFMENIKFGFENNSELPDNFNPLVYAFYSRSPEVDSANYEFYSSSDIYFTENSEYGQFGLYLNSQNVTPGDIWYIRLYPANTVGNVKGTWSYIDPITFNRIITILGKPFRSLITIKVY